MTERADKLKLREYYLDLCMSFFGALRAFSLYMTGHPETLKKVETFSQKLSGYLSGKLTMTWILIGGEVVIENQPLPEVEKALGKVLPMLEKINVERLTFRQGVGTDELAAFFQLLLPLLKEPSGAEMILAKNQERLPHILAGRLPHIHAFNVSALSMAMADELGLDSPMVKEIGLGALLHDTALYESPSDLFSTTAALTLDEKSRYWEHPVRGAELLLASPGIPDIAPVIAYEHHIYYNGKGFPVKQGARELNLGSMIACIADSYDNLRRDRPEQNALPLADALNHMDRNMGDMFHPLLLKKFRALAKAQASNR